MPHKPLQLHKAHSPHKALLLHKALMPHKPLQPHKACSLHKALLPYKVLQLQKALMLHRALFPSLLRVPSLSQSTPPRAMQLNPQLQQFLPVLPSLLSIQQAQLIRPMLLRAPLLLRPFLQLF
jgi:hypothetical protein